MPTYSKIGNRKVKGPIVFEFKSHRHPTGPPLAGAGTGVPSRTVVFTLGALVSIALLTYGLVQVIAIPAVTPAMLMSGSFEPVAIGRTATGLQTCAVVLYAFSSLPLNVLFSIRQYRVSPAGIVLGAGATCLGLIIEIMNMLPGLAQFLYPGKLPPPPEMVSYLRQTTWIRFASLDVAAFTLIFIAGIGVMLMGLSVCIPAVAPLSYARMAVAEAGDSF